MPVNKNSLQSLLQRSSLRVCGINSGTSMDGVDLALLDIRDGPAGPRIRMIDTEQRSYPASLRRALLKTASDQVIDKAFVARLDQSLGTFLARAVHSFIRPSGYGRRSTSSGARRIDLIASHGQTIGHFPDVGRRPRRHATWQIGSPHVIAQKTGITTIGDFRSADIAAGGMGAPLSGYYHHLIFGAEMPVLNIGGIANISVSQIVRKRLKISAFDIGPGNMVSDQLSQQLTGRPFDRDGRLAGSGQVIEEIVTAALAHPYFRKRPPKTCGREEFGASTVAQWFYRRGRPLASTCDLLATALDITIRSIARIIERFGIAGAQSRTLIVTGGGTANSVLMDQLQSRLPGWSCDLPHAWGFSPQFVEPVGFAVLAYETLRGRPGNLGGATGGTPALLGSIALAGADRI